MHQHFVEQTARPYDQQHADDARESADRRRELGLLQQPVRVLARRLEQHRHAPALTCGNAWLGGGMDHHDVKQAASQAADHPALEAVLAETTAYMRSRVTVKGVATSSDPQNCSAMSSSRATVSRNAATS